MPESTENGDPEFMRRAIDLARDAAMTHRSGGPFGCVIVRGDEVVAEGWNEVLATGDHGPRRGGGDSTGVRLRSAPTICPDARSTRPASRARCATACWWARVDRIFFASNHDDAHDFGRFDDRPILEALHHPPERRPLRATELCRDEMLEVWRAFAALPDRPHY